MGFDHTKSLKPEGQFDRNACRAASMARLYKRKMMRQSGLIPKFGALSNENATMPLSGIRKVWKSAKIRAELKGINPAALKKDYAIDSSRIIIFNYPISDAFKQ